MTYPNNVDLETVLRRHCTEAAGKLQPVCLHALAGGGRTRAHLLLQASGRGDAPAVQAACALEMMHAATLLQDDIFDRSTERRGRTAAYLRFGEPQAVLASDWLLLRSLELAAEVDAAFFQHLARAAREMAATVARELHPPFLSGPAAARSHIEGICHGKTASLFAVALHGAALLHAGADRADGPGWAGVGSLIGCTYQLLDDCLDVYAPEGTVNKSTGVDLQQGRLTLPVLAAVQALHAEGRGIAIDRFRDGRLSGTELAALQRALADAAVRACVEEEARTQMRPIAESARKAAVPCGAIDAALADMAAKTALCFGERGKCFSLEAARHGGVLAI